jgi:hypothetical protein
MILKDRPSVRRAAQLIEANHFAARVTLLIGLVGIVQVVCPGVGILAAPRVHTGPYYDQSQARVTKAVGQSLDVILTEGQEVDVRGTGLAIIVRAVRDFTSQGCLGGPVGCQDHVELEVRHGGENQQIRLHVALTEAQRAQGIQQTSVFGYHIALTALHGRSVTLRIDKTQ